LFSHSFETNRVDALDLDGVLHCLWRGGAAMRALIGIVLVILPLLGNAFQGKKVHHHA
jgi:hypothetical protein